MTSRRPHARVIFFGAATLLAVLAGVLALRRLGMISSNSCLSEVVLTASPMPGTKFEVFYTNCDTISKDESVRVYGSPVTRQGSWFERLFDQRELIFDYDPNGNQVAPTIQPVGDRSIMISVGDVGSVFVQRRTWRSFSIDYRIGHIRYPVNAK